jgi:hypothetical protein
MDLEKPGRYVNHSCVPNAGIKQHTQLVALRDISRGEEICYDYSTTMHENHWTMICKCGAPGCRKIVRDFRSLPEPLQRRYLDLEIVQPFIMLQLQLDREPERKRVRR